MEEYAPLLGEVLDDVALDEAVERAAASALRGGEALSADDVVAARARARTIINDARSRPGPPGRSLGGVDGLQDMHALALALGLPVPRILFAEMVARSRASAGQKKEHLRALEKMTPVTETGCIKVDFYNNLAGRAGVAFLVLEPCAADHDLGAQLGKLFPRVSPEKQEELRNHLSMLVCLGRSAYGRMLGQEEDLLWKIAKKLPAGFDPRALGVDPANTTLFLPPPCAKRVGIFVHLESELAATG